MAQTQHLMIRLTVPIMESGQPQRSPMIFHRWLPLGRERGLLVRHGEHTVTVWFDLPCAVWGSDLKESDIVRYSELSVHRFYVDIETTAVEDELLDYMRRRDPALSTVPEDAGLAKRYEAHGEAVFESVSHVVNRLMDFVRIEKGQFWLVPFEELRGSMATTFDAKAQIDGGDWFRWNPTNRVLIKGVLWYDNSPQYIRAEDWGHVQDYIQSDAKPDLTRQLLTGAELLAQTGHDRAALTEAISALEVAVYRFARTERGSQSVRSRLLDRAHTGSLKTLVERLGLTATVNYLLPLIFSEEELPSQLLTECSAAITQRQNVIHQGQRQVDGRALQKFLTAIRSLCEVLLKQESIGG
jgi:hypothetical protein